ncbi:MAG: heme exporter protein CcmB [Gammaproteobacteria bacterium]
MIAAFMGVLCRDMRLACRDYREWVYPLTFFILVVFLFPLAVSPEPQVLRLLAPGVIWVAMLLASLLSLDKLFRADAEDGTLEQFFLSPQPLSILVIGKIFAHWVVAALPLILLTPMIGILLHLSGERILLLALSLLLGTPIISLIGAIGAAITVSLPQGGMLVALLVIPLYIPVLIFGVNGQLMWLAALFFLAVSLAPMVIAAALRIGAE